MDVNCAMVNNSPDNIYWLGMLPDIENRDKPMGTFFPRTPAADLSQKVCVWRLSQQRQALCEATGGQPLAYVNLCQVLRSRGKVVNHALGTL